MKRILLVEDDEQRIRWFKQALVGNILDITDKPDEAIELLKLYNYSLLFLDNDLKNEHYEDMSNMVSGMGYDVALFLEEFQDNNPDMVTIAHTCNPYAGKNICQALRGREVMHIPFPTLKDMHEKGKIDLSF